MSDSLVDAAMAHPPQTHEDYPPKPLRVLPFDHKEDRPASLYQQGKYIGVVAWDRQTLQLQETVLGKDHPDTLRSMMGFAASLNQEGKHTEAEAMYWQTLQLQEKVLGKDHPNTLRSMMGLAVSLNRQGKHTEAEVAYRRTLQLQERVLGRNHPDTLGNMSNLAVSLDQRGKHTEAEAVYRQTLQLQETVLGKNHPDTLRSMNNLAVSLSHQGKHTEAEAIYRQTLQLQETALKKDHPDTLRSMMGLAVSLNKQGKHIEAEAMYRQTLQLQEMVLGKDHPDTLGSMMGLAVSLGHQGKPAEAEAVYRQTLQLLETVLGKDHPNTLRGIMGLVVSLNQQGKYTEAEAACRRTLQLQETELGKDHPDTLRSINSLAVSLDQQGKHPEAEAIYRQTLQLQEKVLGKDHPDTLKSIMGLAVSLNQQGKHTEAEAIYRQTLRLQEKVLGKDHPDTLRSINNLAVSLDQRGKHTEAEAIYRQTLQLQETAFRKDHPDTLKSMMGLAVSLNQQGRHTEAEAMYRQTLQLQEKVLGKGHPDTLRSINNLAVSLDQQGKYAEAEAMYRQMLQLREMVFGKDRPDALTGMSNPASTYRSQGRWKQAEALQMPAISEEKLQEFVNSDASPQTLQSTLASGRIEDVKRLLDENFSSVAKGDFIWLQELREHGYETEEIAQLLATEQNDSPWIYFEPRKLPRKAIIPDHHEAFCVHTGGQEVRLGTGSISGTTSMDRKDHWLSWISENESLMYIEEFCGIAGVIPNTRDPSKRVGSVQFVEEDGTLMASVSFRLDHHSDSKPEEGFEPPGHDDRALPEVSVEHSNNILQALESLCSAIAHAQRSGICCDSFTVLQFNSIVSTQEVIELCQIRVTAVLDLYSKFTSFIANLGVEGGNIQDLMPDTLDCWKSVFQEATLSSFTTVTYEGILDYYSLAVQFPSLGFSSYVKAHVGAIQTFFLDTSLHVIRLFGLQDWEMQSPRLTASLYRLTCLDDMIQNPVLVFGEGRARKQKTQGSYDLLASPEDLVDTWGPGQFVTSNTTAGTQNLTAIMIGGGVIKPTAENKKVLHWSNDVEPRHKFSVHFSSTEKVLIAGGVQVNGACQANRTERWSSFIGSLENLGTAADYWQFTEFQAGVAVMGQQFAGGQLQFNKTWTWHPGNSWKRQHLSLIADELPFSELDRPWGLQVSACTGVARRVPLRLLLADTMPIFAENLALPPGWTTLRRRGIIKALEQGSQDLKQWYDGLRNLPNFQDLQILTKRLIRHILLVLRDTGIDRDHKTFLIACPQDYTVGQPISMCLPVPCENASLWAKILEDSENCATFAYMTNLCLESQEHKCQQTHPWHCPSLDTAVQQLRPRKEPIIMPPQAWNLEVNSLYWIGMPESGLQARVVESADSPFLRLYISKSGVPEKTRARLGTMSRLFGPKMGRLREKQIETWPAEDVLILSQSR